MNKNLLLFGLSLVYTGCIFTSDNNSYAGSADKSTMHNQIKFIEACKNQDIKAIQSLLNGSFDFDPNILITEPDGIHISALGIATQEGYMSTVKTLLADKRIEPNAFQFTYPSGVQMTALGLATKKGHTNIAKALLDDKRIEPNAFAYAHPKGKKLTALSLACEKGHTDIAKALLGDKRVDPTMYQHMNPNGAQATALGFACQNGHTDATKALLGDKRINATAYQFINTSGVGITALGLASYNGRTATVQALLTNQRIEPNAFAYAYPNGKQVTALSLASEEGYVDTVKTLLDDPRVSFKRVTSKDRNAYQVAHSYQLDSEDQKINKNQIRELIKKRAIQEQSTCPIRLSSFEKDEELHFLNCCSNFTGAEEFSDWVGEDTFTTWKSNNQGPLSCPSCGTENINQELDTFIYPYESKDEEESSDLKEH